MQDERLLVAVDVDGTLVNTEMDDGLRKPEIRAIRMVRDAGHVLALCTGRGARSAAAIVASSDGALTGVPQVLLNGALVLGDGDGRILRNGGLPRWIVGEIALMFREAGAMPIVFDMEEDGGRLRVEKSEPNPVLSRYLERRRENVGRIEVHDDITEALPDFSQEIGTIEEKDLARDLAAKIEDRYGSLVSVVITQTMLERDTYLWLEVMPSHCHKGTGLGILALDLGIPAERIVAIGDNYNDLDMFLLAGHSVAMGNAPIDVQRLADRVALPVDQHGAALVLEEIARGEWPHGAGGVHERST